MLAFNKAQLDRLKTRLDAIPSKVGKAVTPATKASCEALAAEMQRLCPVDRGALRDSIKVVEAADGRFSVEAGGPSAPYAQHVEFGTSKMHAEPFFMPAYRAQRASIISNVKRAAIAAAKTAGKS